MTRSFTRDVLECPETPLPPADLWLFLRQSDPLALQSQHPTPPPRLPPEGPRDSPKVCERVPHVLGRKVTTPPVPDVQRLRPCRKFRTRVWLVKQSPPTPRKQRRVAVYLQVRAREGAVARSPRRPLPYPCDPWCLPLQAFNQSMLHEPENRLDAELRRTDKGTVMTRKVVRIFLIGTLFGVMITAAVTYVFAIPANSNYWRM